MPYIILLIIYRNPSLTPTQFRDYLETKHMPLLQSLAGEVFPRVHSRRYIDRQPTETSADSPSGVSGYPANVLAGSVDFFDYDCVVEHVHESEDAFKVFFAKMMGDPEVAAKLQEDEEVFMDRGRMKAVVVSEVAETRQ
jgi:EthD domain